MSPVMYPISLSLAHKRVLIVGGGVLAAQKLGTLESTGADVVLVAPRIAPECLVWCGEGTLVTRVRPFVPEDLAGMALVFAATDDVQVNHDVITLARSRGVLANAVDDPAYCDFHTPAVIRRGTVTLAVSSDGRFPGLTRAVRQVLDALLPERDDDLVDALVSLRAELRAGNVDARERSRVLQELIAQFRDTYLHPPQRALAEAGEARATTR